MSLFHFLQQISPFATDCARRPYRAGWLEKNHPRYAPVFFSAKPCRDAGKQTTGTTRNKNACSLQADNV